MTLFAADTAPLRPVTRILIANRGEIAVRIICACRDEGIAAIAAYADADRNALFVRMADAAYALGGDSPADTYLDAARLIAIAHRAGPTRCIPAMAFCRNAPISPVRCRMPGWSGSAPTRR